MKFNKQISLIMSLIMAFSVIVGCFPVYGETQESLVGAGLCVHHPAHTSQCGYTPAQGGQSCSHVHDESCGYVPVQEGVACDLDCANSASLTGETAGSGAVDQAQASAQAGEEAMDAVENSAGAEKAAGASGKSSTDESQSQSCSHLHDAICGYMPDQAAIPCDQECTDLDGDGTIDHEENCAYQPAIEGQLCTHVHDASCGGVTPRESAEQPENSDTSSDQDSNQDSKPPSEPNGAQSPEITDQPDAQSSETSDQSGDQPDAQNPEGSADSTEGETQTGGAADAENADGANTADPAGAANGTGNADSAGGADSAVSHAPGCAYVPASEGQPCNHVHDESCGYVPASEGTPCRYAVEGCPYCIASWQWVDPQGLLTQTDGVWTMAMAGVSQSQPLTQEALAQMLPTQILATTQTGQQVSLAITWDLTALPQEGATSGSYTVTAQLDPTPENYALAQQAPALSVALELGGAQTQTVLPEGEAPFTDHIVSGVSPNGTTINLFDYWLTTNQTDADNSDPSDRVNKGINADHLLLFRAAASGSMGTWNLWTNTSAPRKGIVADTLENGYPKLNVNIASVTDPNMTDRDPNESLAYLFDPTIEHEGKESYEDVHGLLQVDSEGYYYYNSQENYAVYYAEDNAFTLYEHPGVLPGGSSPVGQFFPFNEATHEAVSHTQGGEQYTLMSTVKSNATSINHYFGMHMSTRFIQQNGGHTDASREVPVTYEFSGDDDVWIFIDDQLVVDLGGIHNMSAVSIDFSTGDVYINDLNRNHQQDAGEVGYEHYMLGTKLGLASNTLADDTYHTLDFFYLERGNVDSNLYLKYNLVTIPESDLIKVDQLGDPVPGAQFALYGAADYEAYGENATPVATGTTDANGEFVFLKPKEDQNESDSLPITIDELYERYKDQKDAKGNNLVLVETYMPEGYRSGGTVGLRFDTSAVEGEVLLLSSTDSIWKQGAYAMPKVTVTTSNSIRLLQNAGDPNGGASGGEVQLVGNHAVGNPLMFAVVFQKQKDGSWHPVSGDPLSGWTVQPGGTWDNVLAAAQDSPYLFQIASSGAYQVEINNLPGSILNYYHICKDLAKAQYTIAYYYTTAPTLAQADETNTWRIDSEITHEEDDTVDLSRMFSVDLYVTNIKNRLLVQKVDEDGATVNGAVFALYKADEVTVQTNADGTVQVQPKAGANPATVTTGEITMPVHLSGAAVFPSAGNFLANGEYYLVEQSAPTGYKPNANATHVIVDNTGVYADAGIAGDDITVLRGVGSVMRSMIQFAVDDGVDVTLRDIQASLATSVTLNADGYNEEGSFTISDADWTNPLHLQYSNAENMLDYGLHDGTAQSIDDLTRATDVGWSKLLIRQCYQHDKDTDTSLKTELVERDENGKEVPRDITGLFSGTVTVRVSNDKTGNLKIEKTVTGEGAPASQSFTFHVTVTDEGQPLSGTYKTLNGAGQEGTVNISGGEVTITLKGGESLIILALPTYAEYTVEEQSVPERYTPKLTVTGSPGATVSGTKVSGTIQHDTSLTSASTAGYTNDFDGSTTLQLAGVKTLLGRPLESSDQFTFTLAAGDNTTQTAVHSGHIVLPQKPTVTVSGDSTGNSKDFLFDFITFKKEGVYTFTLSEVLPTGVSADAPTQGTIWYDTAPVTVTVNVTRGADGVLQAVPVYNNTGDWAQSADTTQGVFTNLYSALAVTKQVTGEMGDRDKAFDFTLSLQDANGAALSGTYRYTIQDASGQNASLGTVTLNTAGAASFQLRHGQTITFFGLPAGSAYTLTEPGAKADGYTVRVTVASNTVTADHTSGMLATAQTAVQFENSKGSPPITGIFLDHWPWLLALGAAGAGIVALMLTSRTLRRKKGGTRYET